MPCIIKDSLQAIGNQCPIWDPIFDGWISFHVFIGNVDSNESYRHERLSFDLKGMNSSHWIHQIILIMLYDETTWFRVVSMILQHDSSSVSYAFVECLFITNL